MKILNMQAFWALLLFFPVSLFSFYQFQNKWQTFLAFGGNRRQKKRFRFRFLLDRLCLFIFMLTAILAYADIYWGTHPVRYENSGLDIVMLLDVSNSMLATDVEPSRLDEAKSYAQEIIYSLPHVRMGGTVFKGTAIPAIPLTNDLSSLTAFLRSAHPNQLTAPGSNLAQGIDASVRLFNNDSSRKQVMVVFSDGEMLSGNLNQALKKARDHHISIFTVGIGSDQGITLFDATGQSLLDRHGNPVHSRLEESALIQAARLTGGRYFKAESTTLNELITELKNYQTNEYRIEMEDQSLFNFFVILILVSLTARMAIRSAKWQELYGSY